MSGGGGSQGVRGTSLSTMILYILAMIGAYAVLSMVQYQGMPRRPSSIGSAIRKAADGLKNSLRKSQSVADGGAGGSAPAGGVRGTEGSQPAEAREAEQGGAGGGGSGGAPGRWRGNDYVNEDGVLPYQRCGASDFSPGPRPLYGVISMNGTRYDQVVLGATMWGEADSTGKPTRVDTLQLLFFTQSQEGKCESVHYSAHCYLPEVLPTVSMRVGGKGAPWQKCYREQRVLDIWSTVVGRQNVASDPVQCPFPGGVEALTDKFEVELRIGDDDREGLEEANIVVDMCYTHVDKASDVTICTQPQFLYSTTAGYWVGKPPYSNYTTLDSFILYHMELQGMSLVISDVQTSVEAALEPYRGDGRVVYRPNWGLYAIQRKPADTPYNPYSYQTQCETACFWEQRTRARWVFFLHSADCYVLPSTPGETFVSLLRNKVNRSQVSEIKVPTVEAHSPHNVTFEGNVIRRFSLLGRGGLLKQKRFTPLGNPRHFDSSNVHVFTANHTTAKASLGTKECIFELFLRTIHIYAIARSNSDAHKGRVDDRWIQIGHELEALLARDYPRRAKYRESIAAQV